MEDFEELQEERFGQIEDASLLRERRERAEEEYERIQKLMRRNTRGSKNMEMESFDVPEREEAETSFTDPPPGDRSHRTLPGARSPGRGENEQRE